MNEAKIQELIAWLQEASESSFRGLESEMSMEKQQTLGGAYLAYQHALRKVQSLL